MYANRARHKRIERNLLETCIHFTVQYVVSNITTNHEN